MSPRHTRLPLLQLMLRLSPSLSPASASSSSFSSFILSPHVSRHSIRVLTEIQTLPVQLSLPSSTNTKRTTAGSCCSPLCLRCQTLLGVTLIRFFSVRFATRVPPRLRDQQTGHHDTGRYECSLPLSLHHRRVTRAGNCPEPPSYLHCPPRHCFLPRCSRHAAATFAYPAPYGDLVAEFGYDHTSLSLIINVLHAVDPEILCSRATVARAHCFPGSSVRARSG